MKFIEYKEDYRLGYWTYDGDHPYNRVSILGETDKETYFVFFHSSNVFGEMMKQDCSIIDMTKDVNFKKGWCIRIKGVDHHINTQRDRFSK